METNQWMSIWWPFSQTCFKWFHCKPTRSEMFCAVSLFLPPWIISNNFNRRKKRVFAFLLLTADGTATMGNWRGLCRCWRNRIKSFSPPLLTLLSMSHIYTHIDESRSKPIVRGCWSFKQPFLPVIVNSNVENREKLFDEKTGNMQNLSSIEPTFLVSLSMREKF